MNYYTGNIANEKNTVFVFGSNPEGRHGAGAARVARLHFGARYGKGEGLMWDESHQIGSYAIPTKDLRVLENNSFRSISPEQITCSIQNMYAVARLYPQRRFMIAYRNTYSRSLNGYTGIEMMRMFLNAGPIPENVWVSKEWYDTGMFSKQ